MSGKKKSTKGIDPRFEKYKSGLNIIDELKKLDNLRLNVIFNR